MNIYMGVDPSVNSTGVCIIKDGQPPCFVIIKPHLTKYEKTIDIDGFHYMEYVKKETMGDVHTDEVTKTENFREICDIMEMIIESEVFPCSDDDHIYVCMEGISYGSSVRTKSVYDLAGLNFMIRYKFLLIGIPFIIAPPSEVKKFITGKGNADKEQIVKCFLGVFPQYEPLNRNSTTKVDDIADAFFMARYARYLMESGQ